MDIPGKLRADLKRIYGADDPLNYLEDITVSAVDPTGYEQMLTVNLRVPSRMQKYVASTSFGRVPPGMLDALSYSVYGLGDWRIPGPRVTEQRPPKRDPMELVDFLTPTKIIYSGPKTIVFWPDGTKTIVSLGEGQEHDDYMAYCAAVVKKMFGSTPKAKKFLEKVSEHPVPKPKKEKPWEQMEMMPMPGTEDPNWGQKHWAPEEV